jgi:hypothetical protein
MGEHVAFRVATGVPVYFCDPLLPLDMRITSCTRARPNVASGYACAHGRCSPIIRCHDPTNRG